MALLALLDELHPDWHAGDAQAGLDAPLAARAATTRTVAGVKLRF